MRLACAADTSYNSEHGSTPPSRTDEYRIDGPPFAIVAPLANTALVLLVTATIAVTFPEGNAEGQSDTGTDKHTDGVACRPHGGTILLSAKSKPCTKTFPGRESCDLRWMVSLILETILIWSGRSARCSRNSGRNTCFGLCAYAICTSSR
jgi:hypothetical protein